MTVRVALIALAGCMSPKPPKAAIADEEYDPRAAWTHAREDPFCTESTFDASNPNCEFICTRVAPQGWPHCEEIADSLIARGYICQRRTPYACQPPPNAVLAGIKYWRAIDTAASITIDAGSDRGVALTWSAQLLDRNHLPIGDIVLVVVDADAAIGALTVPSAMQSTAAGVLLQPPPSHAMLDR